MKAINLIFAVMMLACNQKAALRKLLLIISAKNPRLRMQNFLHPVSLAPVHLNTVRRLFHLMVKLCFGQL